MIDSIIVWVGCGWLLYRFFKTRRMRPLFATGILLIFQVSQWPFYVQTRMILGAMALFAALVCLYEFYRKREETIFISFAILFFLFGALFLSEFLIPTAPPGKGSMHISSGHP